MPTISHVNKAEITYPKGTVFNPFGSKKQVISSGSFRHTSKRDGYFLIADAETNYVVFNSNKDKWAKVIRTPFTQNPLSEGDLIHELNYSPINNFGKGKGKTYIHVPEEPVGYLFEGKLYLTIEELKGRTFHEGNKPEPVYLRK